MRVLRIVTCCLLATILSASLVERADAQRTEFPTPLETPPPVQVVAFAPPPLSAPPFGSAPPAPVTLGPPIDPYSTDPTVASNGLYQPGAVAQPATGQGYLYTQPNGMLGEVPRFLQQVRFRYTWIKGNNDADSVETNTGEIDGTFVIPFLYNQNAPLLITPGFSVDFTEGPQSSTGADLPPRLYSAYLDLAWQPHITERLSADLGFRTGAYTDFSFFDWNGPARSVRYLGRGFGVYDFSPQLQLRAGVIYIDRVRLKLLPAGGLVWKPDVDTRWDILFPNPKFAQRFTTIGNTDFWWYVAGEYGGGSWSITRDPANVLLEGAPSHDRVDINDLRVMLGVEWTGQLSVKGFVEAGYVWHRQLEYASGVGDIDMPNTLMLRGGIAY